MLAGAVALIPALLTLWALIRLKSPRLALCATCLGERIALGTLWIAFSFVALNVFRFGLPTTVQEQPNNDDLGAASNNRQ